VQVAGGVQPVVFSPPIPLFFVFFPSQAVDRIKKEIAKIKEKEKKAYGKMFG